MFEFIVSAGLLLSVVFAVGALSGYMSERAGIVNIAIDGMMVFGALIYAILRNYLTPTGIMQIPAWLIAILATGIFSFLHAFICVRLKANQVISGTAINLLAGGIALFLINVVFKRGNLGLTAEFPYVGVQDDYSKWANWLNVLVLIALATMIALYFIMRFTRVGLRLKASGENPHALATQGVSVARTRYTAVFISGVLAGFAGTIFAQNQPAFYGTVNGYGFISLAILIAGQWRIPLLVLAASVFGVLTAFAQSTNSALPTFIKENRPLILALPFFVSLVALVFFSKRSRAPQAIGIPYELGRR